MNQVHSIPRSEEIDNLTGLRRWLRLSRLLSRAYHPRAAQGREVFVVSVAWDHLPSTLTLFIGFISLLTVPDCTVTKIFLP